ncbi:DUF397 domain-containing protein [Nonomuraea sp. NPDC003709]|uniref:DUF397 domain-containing protein n=1 Tax=Nonomuraea sp. NPDC003709 TaxID=3154450 RepID=UPI0033BF9081
MNQVTPASPKVWHRSLQCGATGSCVEVGVFGDGRIGLRDSKNPSDGIIALSPAEYESFLGRIKRGEVRLA